MSFLTNRLAFQNPRELSPGITPEEERWWSVERKKHFRRHLLGMGLPMFLVFTVGMAISKPEKLLVAPVFAAIAVGAAWMQARLAERHKRDQEVKWKRIRDSLLAESDGDQIEASRQPAPDLPSDSHSTPG
jgi:hypothetical protein